MVQSIYQWFLDGNGLRGIKEQLEAQGIPSPKGKDQWSIATIRSILSNEKYKGDVLLQKTYRPSLFSEKAMVNNGELPKYYISDCLPHIVEPEVFDRAQEELAKRISKRPVSENAKTPFGRYSGKYALSALVVCGRCGSLYRRITWHRRGKVKVVWRCGAHQDKAANRRSSTRTITNWVMLRKMKNPGMVKHRMRNPRTRKKNRHTSPVWGGNFYYIAVF